MAVNIDVARVVVADTKHSGRIVEYESGLVKIFAAHERLSVGRNKFRHEIQPQNIGRLRIKSGIRHGTLAVTDLRDDGTGTQQMRLSVGAHSGTAQKASINLRGRRQIRR